MKRLWPALVLLLAACAGKEPGLPAKPLPTLASSPVSLSGCPTKVCLTVYVAPWCHYCRGATPAILQLRDDLAKRDVSTRIVVGLDSQEAVRAYAATFGPDTVLDPHGTLGVNGVPHFFVSDPSGKIVRELPGLPPRQDAEGLADYLGLNG